MKGLRFLKRIAEIMRIILGLLVILIIAGGAVCYAIFARLDGFDKASSIIFVGVPLVGITCARAFFGNHTYKKMEVYKSYYERKVSWIKLNITWLVIHYWLISLSFFAPSFLSIISAYEKVIDPYKIVIYSLISIFGTLLNLLMRPDKQAYGYRIAFGLLDKKLFEVVNLPEDEEAEQILRKALETGEKYITHATYCTYDVNDCG